MSQPIEPNAHTHIEAEILYRRARSHSNSRKKNHTDTHTTRIVPFPWSFITPDKLNVYKAPDLPYGQIHTYGWRVRVWTRDRERERCARGVQAEAITGAAKDNAMMYYMDG